MDLLYAAPAWGARYRPRWGLAQAPPAQSVAGRRALISLGVIGTGVALGLAAWPHVRRPLGAIALGAAGSMVAVGLTFIVLDLLGVQTPPNGVL